MATAGSNAPFMGTVSVTATATSQDLFTLLSAIWSNLPHKGCLIQVQCGAGAGSAHLYIGNSNVSATMCGYDLVAAQANNPLVSESNIFILDQIFLVSSTGTITANVMVGVR